MPRKQHFSWLMISLLLTLATAGCQRNWSFSIKGLAGGSQVIDYQAWQEYSSFVEDGVISVEQILYGSGARVIDEIVLVDQEGIGTKLSWSEAGGELKLTKQGTIQSEDLEVQPASILVNRSDWEDRVEGHIYDLAATAAAALGIPAPELSSGTSLAQNETADAVLLLFLDGFGYIRYQEALNAGLIPQLAKLDPPLVGLTTYPPITTVSSASLLTGTEPMLHGVEGRGIRQTEHQTLLEAAAQANLSVVAVEGEALAFNLRGAELELSGDRDGDGGTDDNVLANALAVLDQGMPDLFWVHFHGIDDQGHEVGPGQPAEEDKIREVDAAVGQILERVPPDTLVIIFADHGMHTVNQDGRVGNHGNLIPRDMLIPIWITKTD